MKNPIVDATLKVNTKPGLPLCCRKATQALRIEKGVVEFVNKKAPKIDSMLKSQLDSLRKSNVTWTGCNS